MSQAVELDVQAEFAETAATTTDGVEAVRFEGVAVGTGTYTAAGGLKIRIEERHLELIAERLRDVQIRDLHEERIQATVGAVQAARVEGDDVLFEGEVAIQPHATIVRRFPESIRFSVGFRFSAADLEFGPDDVAPLPADFLIDHIAIVGQGQDPDARLTKLLNEAVAGLGGDGTVDKDTVAELRRQRDEALEADKKARADLAKSEERLETVTDKLELAEKEVEAARLELSQARTHFADSILKMELRAGKDVDLTERREELLDLELGKLDKLRLDLADELAAEQDGEDGPASKPGTGGGQPAEVLDLSELSPRDTIRLGLLKGAI